jgi:proline iminopeptidase
LRLKEPPEELDYTLKHINKRVFHYMEGPDDLNMTGTLKDWDVTGDLHKIEVPCLITVGKYDSVPIAVSESIHANIKNSKLVGFENSGHFAMWEERERYIQVLRDFLDTTK